MNKTAFDDIRPYYDEEIPAAMVRISEDDMFAFVASFVYPNMPIDEVKHLVSGYRTTREFQVNTMAKANERIIENSINEFSGSGLERLDKDKAYLYVSNHRDIMLDASLLEYLLVMNGFDTTEITFGANLMSNQFVVDIGKSNKMFRVERPGKDIREFYRSSKHVSEYIRYAITGKGQSVWIAQRNGRTKNGNDVTDYGVLKMFGMSGCGDRVRSLAELNIVPMCISYEWEPCDVLKTMEVYESTDSDYVKKRGEDMNSIVTGILQDKGRVHIELCEPLSEDELRALSSLSDREYYAAVAEMIDGRIYDGYRLYPNNFIAYDRLHGTALFEGLYDIRQKEEFLSHLDSLRHYGTYDIDRLEKIYLGIYANSVENKMRRNRESGSKPQQII